MNRSAHMMRSSSMTLFLMVLATGHLSTQTVRVLSVEGHSHFSSSDILSRLALREGDRYSKGATDEATEQISQRYRQSGYLACRTRADVGTAADSSWVDIAFVIDEGALSVVEAIVLSGCTFFRPEDLLARFDVTHGSLLISSQLEKDIDDLLDEYEHAGFPFTSCSVALLEEVEPGRLRVHLVVEEGPRHRIDEIAVDGNTDTDDIVITRAMRIGEGEVFDPDKFSRIQPRLRRLNIFQEVEEPQLYRRNDRGGILVKVKEGNTNTFDGIVGYVPGTATGGSGYVTGLVHISMRNLFGTVRKLNVRWQRDDRFSQELGFRYMEPWLLSLPLNVEGGLFQRKQDTVYIRRAYDVRAEYMVNEELSLGGFFLSESVIPSATTLAFSRSSTISGGVDVIYDDRDDPLSPVSGVQYRTDYSYGRKKLDVEGRSLSRQRITIDTEYFLSPLTRQVIALGAHGKDLRGDEVEESEMYRFGGARSVRGYRENELLAQRLGWLTAEYRVLLSRRSFLYGFCDTGYYWRPGNSAASTPATEKFIIGYGIGAQVESGLGVLGVSFALAGGESFGQGKIHFGLINEF